MPDPAPLGPSFDIAGRAVGGDAPVYIVAELSANHAGSLDVARRSIEAAARAGVDAVKLQTYTPDTLTLKSDAEPFVVRTPNEWHGRTLHDLYREAMTPWEWHAPLAECAAAAEVQLFSTPFDVTAVAFLEQLGVPCHKVASFELTDLPLIDRVARTGKPVILSTGMASLDEIEAAVRTCRAAGNHALALLRCVSTYPARPDMMNLQSFARLAGFGAVVGLSDHTRDHTVAIASVALGARLVEKHFILERALGGPDAFFSLEPDELRGLVQALRDTERALGAPRFGVSEDERQSARFRRSLFVAEAVPAGGLLTARNVRSVRPADGLAPRHLPEVLGRRATRALAAGTPLAWDQVGEAPPPGGLAVDDAGFTPGAGGQVSVRRGTDALARCGLAPAGADTLHVELPPLPAEAAEAALRALEAWARPRGVARLTLRCADAAAVTGAEQAGWHGFVEDAGPERRLTAERRLTPLGA